jgi:hypothetical protein
VLALTGLTLPLVWARGALWSAAGIALIGVFVLAAGAVLRSLRRASRTVYLLTDRRLVRLRLGRSAADLSFDLSQAKSWKVRPHADGTGDVLFANGEVFDGVRDAHSLEAALANQLASRPVPDDDEPLPFPVWTARLAAGAVCCVASPLFDPLGYVMTVLGLVLIWGRSAFPVNWRLAVIAVVLPPRILPILFSALAGPGEFSFVLDPNAPATSSASWGWFGLLLAVSAALALAGTAAGRESLAIAGIRWRTPMPGVDGLRTRNRWALPGLAAAVLIAWGIGAVLGLGNQFEWIEAGRGGAWELKHTVRRTVATFTPDSVALIECRAGEEESAIRVVLRTGASYRMRTRAPSAWGELKKLAAAMELPPRRMHVVFPGGGVWTNGDFSLKLRTGAYETAGGRRIELRLENGRLAGTETLAGSAGKLERALRAVKVTEDGTIEYRTEMFSGPWSNFAVGFGFSQGRFDGERLVIDGARFRKLPFAVAAPGR